jgi:glutaredoxin
MSSTNALIVIGSILFIGLLISLTGLCNFYAPDCKIIWFHRPGCGYCTQMSDEWDAFTSQVPSSIKVEKIDVSQPQNMEMARSYGVQGVPHIVKEKYGIRSVFEGNRKAREFMKFALE